MTVRTAPAATTPDAEARILALNNAHASEPSWLDPVRLAALIGQSFYAPRIDDAEAFLIAFDRDAGPAALLLLTSPDGTRMERPISVAPRDWPIERVDAPYRAGKTDAEFAVAPDLRSMEVEIEGA